MHRPRGSPQELRVGKAGGLAAVHRTTKVGQCAHAARLLHLSRHAPHGRAVDRSLLATETDGSARVGRCAGQRENAAARHPSRAYVLGKEADAVTDHEVFQLRASARAVAASLEAHRGAGGATGRESPRWRREIRGPCANSSRRRIASCEPCSRIRIVSGGKLCRNI